MVIKINHSSQTPIYIQIKNQIREQVLLGTFQSEGVLPSERKLAEQLGVHRNTIIKAYHELKADGLIDGVKGSGHKVVYHLKEQEQGVRNCKHGIIPWQLLFKKELENQNTAFEHIFTTSYSDKVISFAGGIMPPEVYCKEDIKQVLMEAMETQPNEIYEYAPYQGLINLRKNIRNRLKEKAVKAKLSEIQVVADTNQVINHISELFISKGDCVITEEPISPEVYRAFRLAGAKIITVPMDHRGMISSVLEKLVNYNQPKLIYVNSSFHDPTGVVTSLDRRKEILEISYKYRVPIIEDDSASAISYTSHSIPTFKSLDRHGSVIYIFSFALTFAPGLKLAFLVAPKTVVEKLVFLMSLYMVSVDSLSQHLMSAYLEKGLYEKNLEQIKVCYKEKRDVMVTLLEEGKSLGLLYEKPLGGIYIWCKLPKGIQAEKLYKKACKKGVVFMPGSLFFPNGTKGESFIRLNYSYPSIEQIKVGIPVLLSVIKKMI